MRALLVLAVFFAVSLGGTLIKAPDNKCAGLRLVDNLGNAVNDDDVLESFGEQITDMREFGQANTFNAARFENGKYVSEVLWSLCENLDHMCPNAGKPVSCCEVYPTGESKVCGVFDHGSSTFILDRFLQYQAMNASLIAGISLRYMAPGVRVNGNFAGATGEPAKLYNLCFLLDLKCDPIVKYFQVPRIDAEIMQDNLCLRARVETQHACVAAGTKFLHLTPWKILFYVMAPLAIIAGLVLLALGWRLFRLASLVLGLFFGLSIAGVVILFSVFLACEATKPRFVQDFWTWSHECTFHYLTDNAAVGIVASVSGLLFGAILAVAAYKKPHFGGVLIGMTVGTWVADYIYVTTFAVLKQHWIVLLLTALFIPMFALLGACLPNSWKRSFFIILLSATGAYLFCWGIGAYTRFFPSLILLDELGPRWQYFVFTIAIVLLTILGSLLQFIITGNFDWDTLMESGLCPARGNRRKGRKTDEALLSTPSETEEVELEKVNKVLKEISDVGEK